jgi:hypothetical protein
VPLIRFLIIFYSELSPEIMVICNRPESEKEQMNIKWFILIDSSFQSERTESPGIPWWRTLLHRVRRTAEQQQPVVFECVMDYRDWIPLRAVPEETDICK